MWFDVIVNEDTIDSFIVQTFFTMVEEHDRQLEKNILLQISQANWNCLHLLYPNHYQIDFRKFIQKVCQRF
jgi:hypothetical protein